MDLTSLPEAAYIRIDLYPATVTDRQGTKRVIVTDSHLVIAGDSNTGPEIQEVYTVYDFEGSNKTGWTVTLEDEGGEQIYFKRASGCGCGSRLRGAKIYPGVKLKRN